MWKITTQIRYRSRLRWNIGCHKECHFRGKLTAMRPSNLWVATEVRGVKGGQGGLEVRLAVSFLRLRGLRVVSLLVFTLMLLLV
jgi:hypothetical protein